MITWNIRNSGCLEAQSLPVPKGKIGELVGELGYKREPAMI